MHTVKEVEVLGKPMEVFLFPPKGEGPRPGILLAQHIPMGHTGIENDKFTLATAQRLADNGFFVAVPFLFHWWPKEELMEIKKAESRDEWMVADMQAGYRLLTRQEGVDPARIGVVGHCWGGRVAWLAACHLPELKALAVFYGGNIKKGLGERSVPPIELTPRIPCPVIGFFGNEDSNPSPDDVEDYGAALSDAGISHEFHQYEGAGHAFQNFPAPERYREQASEDAWAKLLVFLKEKLQR